MSRLVEIFDNKRREVAAARERLPLGSLKERALAQPPARGFRASLLRDSHAVSLIAEVKRASPSQGVIREEFDPVGLATAYVQAGAACLSVLTDERYFLGTSDHLQSVRAAVDVPILRKDFVFDPYQLWETRALGADCALLIVAGVGRSDLADLYAEARNIGLDVLVEVHDEAEAEAAIELGADLIGVNSRNLATFETDLSVFERLAPKLLPHATLVAESAISSHAEVARVQAAGAQAVLIGTAFSAAPSPGAKVREVMGW